MTQPSVRRATPADATAMAELNAVVQSLHAGAHPEIFEPADPAIARPDFERWLADPTWYGFLAEDGTGRAVGYAGAHPIVYPANPFLKAFTYLRLDQMAVLPEREGEGFGTALVRAVVDLARDLGHDQVQLNVWSFNERARRLYEKEGFEVFRVEMFAKVDSPTLKNVE